MPVLYGIHDQEGAHLVPPKGWCVALTALSEHPEGVNYGAIRGDINWLVRVNWGYGSTGTIPQRDKLNEYLDSFSRFVRGSQGVYGYIIGNEPNHEQERPDGQYITPLHYATFYNAAYSWAKELDIQSQIIVAAPAPYHANPVKWTDWYNYTLNLINYAQGFAIHAYTRSSVPYDIDNMHLVMADGELRGQYSGFLTYREALAMVPERFRNLPVYLTEFNELLENGWDDRNTGVVQAAYSEIDRYNQGQNTQKIHCLCLYRYPNYDKWGFQNKNGVLDDFANACGKAISSPVQTFLPEIGTTMPKVIDKASGAPNLVRDLDARALARGVQIQPVDGRIPGPVWRVKKIHWLDEQESQGRHHFYFDVLDEQGNRLVGVPIRINWPTGTDTVKTEAKPGEPYSANFPMSPSRNEFVARIIDGNPSETVSGVGMGMQVAGGFNAGIHTSTFVVFQRVAQVQPPSQVPGTPTQEPELSHPLGNYEPKTITQHFGENPQDYAKFNLDGHNGVDFAVPVGTMVYAVDPGQVAEVQEDAPGYGKYVKLIHKWGESLYAHLNVQYVQEGSFVTKGQLIGLSGNTGNSSGPHLHFGIRVNPYKRGKPYDGYVNPELFLNKTQDAPATEQNWVQLFKRVASEFELDWQLLASLAWAESSFRYDIQDGLLQVGDATWSDYASKLGATSKDNPLDNTRVGAAYMKDLIAATHGNIYQALYAYNWGLARVQNNQEVPEETKCYANKVVHGRDLLKALGGAT